MTELGRDLWRSYGPISPAQAGPGRSGCPGPCPACFWISPGRKTPQSPEAGLVLGKL